MRTFANANARTAQDAVTLAQREHARGRATAFASGGSDLLALIKDRIVRPDTIVNLRTVKDGDRIGTTGNSVTIGAQVTLEAISQDASIQELYAVLAEAASSVATPQIRNVATLAGNVCQRPWCWYFRNGFPCYKAGGNQCFSFAGENQFHAIFGGGPSYIVHPSDTAPALVALDATFTIVGPSGTRTLPANEFFILPRQNARQENTLGNEDVLVSVQLPARSAGTRSTYFKVLDREAWTHAVVSVAVLFQMDGQVCRSARVVLGGVAPIPWRLLQVEELLTGQRITHELATRAGEAAVAGARPLSKNAYKIPLTKGVVKRTILELGLRE